MLHWQILVSLVFALAVASASAQEQDTAFGQRLILNVYLDNAGKALITGYAENISSLSFLNSSQYRYENETNQLYALTDSLTTKEGDLWTLRFDARGFFGDFRTTFILPSDMRLGKINASNGLSYLLSASNESLLADVQGYEVHDPNITVEYQHPLTNQGSMPLPPPPGFVGNYLNLALILAAASLLFAGAALIVFMAHRESASRKSAIEVADAITAASSPPEEGNGVVETDQVDDGVYFAQEQEPYLPSDQPPEDMQLKPEPSAHEAAGTHGEAVKREIVVSSEMEAVMQTLTARERAVLKTLIDHGGRMTQAEIRYETGTPKSSLTGILISLERRKLVTKKEYGRTNIIELSDWFLSGKERS
ncbi:MAG: helix-turn-helix domain-containing protein [Methanothrix sp.]|nr:helix-turn-helix domain-containing protein [Methanothrix sp.]